MLNAITLMLFSRSSSSTSIALPSTWLRAVLLPRSRSISAVSFASFSNVSYLSGGSTVDVLLNDEDPGASAESLVTVPPTKFKPIDKSDP